MNPTELFKSDRKRIVLVSAPLNPPRTLIVDTHIKGSVIVEDDAEHIMLVEELRAHGADVWEWNRYRDFISKATNSRSAMQRPA